MCGSAAGGYLACCGWRLAGGYSRGGDRLISTGIPLLLLLVKDLSTDFIDICIKSTLFFIMVQPFYPLFFCSSDLILSFGISIFIFYSFLIHFKNISLSDFYFLEFFFNFIIFFNNIFNFLLKIFFTLKFFYLFRPVHLSDKYLDKRCCLVSQRSNLTLPIL